MASKIITLAHGSGGQAMQDLIQQLMVRYFNNAYLAQAEDQARIPLAQFTAAGHTLAMTTDSFVIDPIEFPGGNIGKLAICGTANDLAVGGAKPRFLTCSLILEEGLPFDTLERIIQSMADTANAAGIQIVTGDTKVVGRGSADKIFINTAGVATIDARSDWGMHHIQIGDQIIVTGTLGDHGAAILNAREQLGLESDLQSDCAVLWPLVEPLLNIEGIRCLRDATRGGVNAVMHEYAHASGYGMQLFEHQLPLSEPVRGMCELLGLDPLNLANEGKLIIVTSAQSSEVVLNALHGTPLGQQAAIIGQVTERTGVTLTGEYGIERELTLPHFEQLPRIC
ncbi:hydrogenase expression/formation protein HypE [Celerinatantimonas sp. YJH-8]|uniref:hydrogenase expression/formation protein HypE n=1 Tax=Celerinatantimonas sp. YJH-8 TaxID=3228714 RepID=UPI0038C58A83